VEQEWSWSLKNVTPLISVPQSLRPFFPTVAPVLAACEIVLLVQCIVQLKKQISLIMNAAAEFHPPVVKNKALTLFQGPLPYGD